MPTHAAKQLACSLVRTIQLYFRVGFIVQTILMDMEYDKVVPELLDVVINTSVAKEHVAKM